MHAKSKKVASRPVGVFLPPSRLPSWDAPVRTLSAGDAYRPPDWRWRRAGLLLARGGRGTRTEDPAVVAVVRWLRSATRRPAGYLTDRPDLAVARAVYLGAALTPPDRDLLDGYLLAGEGDAVVAARVGLTPAAVAAYHAVFFDVRDRIHRPGFLHPFLMPDWPTVAPDDVPALTRVLGLLGGPFVLDAYRAYASTLPPPIPARPEQYARLTDAELAKLNTYLLLRRYVLVLSPDVPARDRHRWALALAIADKAAGYFW